LKAQVARRVLQEARKPHNQAKAKELFRSLTGKGGSKGAPPPR
jgi:hypothetical protein